MNSVRKLLLSYVCLCISFSIIGCATTKSTWTSKPPVQKEENAIFKVALHPLKDGYTFFTKFRLTVTNKTDDVIKIDWKKTKYVNNGRTRGGFVFKGIEPEDIRNSTIPADTILGEDTFSKVISPYKLVARAPLRESSVGATESTISPGILPTGENGILLVIRQNGKEIVERITLTIVEQQVR